MLEHLKAKNLSEALDQQKLPLLKVRYICQSVYDTKKSILFSLSTWFKNQLQFKEWIDYDQNV